MPSLIGKTLRDQRRLAIGWLVGLACYAALYLSFYGRFEELTEAKMEAIPEGIRTAFGFADFQTGVGFLEAVIYGSIAPILLIVFAITLGNRGIAVAEEEGVLDLYLANPISRVRFLLFRYAVLLGTVLAAV
ncbi:MAG: ABC transporter permease, partial [Micromonosporaceae bacterium]|nr:ABC transporter permease [Micromonosporaceae bacterium]